MRKIVVLAMITLDGVMQAPGGQDEDTSNNFKYGGWVAPWGDDAYSATVKKELAAPADYILGRKTFEIWEPYWPKHADYWPGINTGVKYVLSKTRKNSEWENTTFIGSADDIKKLKGSDGADLHVWGSSELVQLLLKNDLVDELRLKIHPIILGNGKKLFTSDTVAARFELTESTITSKGVIIVTYKRGGEVKIGKAGS